MNVKFLRGPGGNKSDFYFFSRLPFEKSIPTLAHTGKEAVDTRFHIIPNSRSDEFWKTVLTTCDGYIDEFV